jgi:hypothetical protein
VDLEKHQVIDLLQGRAVRDRASFSIAAFSSAVSGRKLIAIGSLLDCREFYKELGGCAT